MYRDALRPKEKEIKMKKYVLAIAPCIAGIACSLAAPATAAVTGEVISAYDQRTTETTVMSATDGKSFKIGSCGRDLSHNGTPRYFIGTVSGDETMPDDYLNSVLVVSDEDCQWRLILAGQSSNMRFSTSPHWSPDGTRIAVYAQAFDLEQGVQAASGVYVADVVYDGSGRPVGIENLALEFSLPGEPWITWSGDGTRIAYHSTAPDGQGGWQHDIFVYRLGDGYSYNLTDTPEFKETDPSWSPADERIAFVRFLDVRGSYRYDIFTISSAGGPATQVTRNKTTGRPQNRDPCFSPDGQSLAFSSGDAWLSNDIFRIRSDGSGKAVNLTSKREGHFRMPSWRR